MTGVYPLCPPSDTPEAAGQRGGFLSGSLADPGMEGMWNGMGNCDNSQWDLTIHLGLAANGFGCIVVLWRASVTQGQLG